MTDKERFYPQIVFLDPALARALDELAASYGVDRPELIAQALRDWLTTMGAIPYREFDEHTEAVGEGWWIRQRLF